MIRTRIAPSPTGPLHLGTSRTALFNFIFSRQNQGEFLLRIEDTDKTRSKKEFEEDILAGLEWLGLKWDGKIVRQSERLEVYQKIAQKLISKGAAYEQDGAVWFKIDQPTTNDKRQTTNNVVFDDLIRGQVSFHLKDLKDFVILKKDGTPTYHFAVVVDDEEMKITHVIRGEDHISNTPLHILLQKALGYKTPIYSHLPLILNKDHSKMSKRKEPISINRDFRDQGYLPEAMVNFMALLGWHSEGEEEVCNLQKLIATFKLERVQKSPAVFDVEKLNYLNSWYIRQMGDEELTKNLKSQISNLKTTIQNSKLDLTRIVAITKDRLKTLNDFAKLTDFFFKLPAYPPELLVFSKSDKEKTLAGLKAASQKLTATYDDGWEKIEKLNQILAETTKENNLQNGDVFWPVRSALSGAKASPSPAELLWALGREESLKRLNKAIEKL